MRDRYKSKQGGPSMLGWILWIINLVYAFTEWGFWHGICNIFIPYALAWDIAEYLIRVLN